MDISLHYMLPIKLDTVAFLERLRAGETEPKILESMGVTKSQYHYLLVKDDQFRKELEEARKARAEVWHEKIAESALQVVEKDEVPGERLKFDKLKWLAEKDNPDRYGDKKTVDTTMNLNVFTIKGVTEAEALKAIQEDPFAVEAEFSVVDNEDDGGVL